MEITEEYLSTLVARLRAGEVDLLRQAKAKEGARQACEHMLVRLAAPSEDISAAVVDMITPEAS